MFLTEDDFRQPEPDSEPLAPARSSAKSRNAADTVRVVGEVDKSNATDLRATLDDAVRRGLKDFVIDLTEVTYLDSAGLTVLWDFVGNGPRLLVRSGSLVERVLAISGLGDYTIFEP